MISISITIIIRHFQLDFYYFLPNSIKPPTTEDCLTGDKAGTRRWEKMNNEKYNIQELLQRDVYVNDKKVGTIVGERHHPNESRVRSMRIQVEAEVADEYMRKPAELAPLPKELVHSIRNDGTVKLSLNR